MSLNRDKLVELIRGELNGLSSPNIEAQEANQIVFKIWQKSNQDSQLCIAAIRSLGGNKPSKRIQDFRQYGLDFLHKLSTSDASNFAKSEIPQTKKRRANNGSKSRSRPKLEDFGAPDTPSDILEAERKALQSEKNLIIVLPCLVIVAVLIFSDLWILPASIVFAMIFWIIFLGIDSLGVTAVNHLIAPLLSFRKKKNDTPIAKQIQVLSDKITKRREFESAVSMWDYMNLVTGKGFWLHRKGVDLEQAVATLISLKGWRVKTTKTVADAGIDLICERGSQKVLIQCKGHAKPLGVGAIRDAAGVKSTENPDSMIVVAPNGFTKPSKEFAKQSGVKLMDANSLTLIASDSKQLL